MQPPDKVVDAGPFGAWLSQFRASLRSNQGTDVPCGDCIGCCVSSYSILVRPEDTQARAAIPAALLTDVPALGRGVKALGYLPDGTCPMLRDSQCTVYGQRPQTCRDYDCRVFAAAGIEAGQGKTVINQRVREWRFSYASEADQAAHAAVRAAAAFIKEQSTHLPSTRLPRNPSGIAVFAVKSYSVFLDTSSLPDSAAEIAARIVECCRRFDAGMD